MKIVSKFFKDDPIEKELKKNGLLTENLEQASLENAIEIFELAVK